MKSFIFKYLSNNHVSLGFYFLNNYTNANKRKKNLAENISLNNITLVKTVLI